MLMINDIKKSYEVKSQKYRIITPLQFDIYFFLH